MIMTMMVTIVVTIMIRVIIMIMMMRSDNENVGKAERRLTPAEDNDNHDNDDCNHDNDKEGYNHAIDYDDEEAIMKTLERQSGA